jgi:replicative DNA helicase
MAKQSRRVPPHSLEAEQCVLGAILLEKDVINKVLELLSPDGSDFYHVSHGAIFKGMVAMHEKAAPIDIVAIAEMFKDSDALNPVGGVSYIGVISESTPTAANVRYYAKLVKEHSVRRWAISRATDLITDAYNTGNKIEDMLECAQRDFNKAPLISAGIYTPIQALLTCVMEKLEKLSKKGVMSGISTGFPELDYLLGGLQPTDLILLAGRPSMGKSSLCCQIATYTAKNEEKVAYFTPEIADEQVVRNILACQGNIDTTKFRRGNFVEEEWNRLGKTVGTMYETNFLIDDISRSSREIAIQSRKIKAEHGLDVIFIDHLQEMTEWGRESRTFGSRAEEVACMLSNLKALAKELYVPVVLVCQLSRKLEERGNNKPRLSDLKESGAGEEKADVVVFIYRDDYYKGDKSKRQGLADIIVAKQRNGPTGDFELKWQEEWLRFENLSHQHTF